MNNLSDLPYFVALLLILTGLVVAIWGFRLWKQPSSLRIDSRLYRYLLTDWQTWPRKRSGAERLTDKQIKYYGIRGFLAGVLLVILGIIMVIKM